MYKDTYIQYRNTLNATIATARNEYYRDKIENSNGNSKLTWRVINEILGRENNQQSEINNPTDVPTEDFINEFFVRSVDEIKSSKSKHVLPILSNSAQIHIES